LPNPQQPPFASADASRLPARLFINYASEDREIAEELFEALHDAGALNVWWDSKNIRGGAEWLTEIDEGLFGSLIVISVLTRDSVDTKKHKWVDYEQERALDLLRPIIPCLFEPEKEFFAEGLLPKHLEPKSVIPFFEDREAGLRRLINSIGGHLPKLGGKFGSQVPGSQDKKFVGRAKDLRALKDLIDNEARTATGRRLVAIHGIGGMGKTMLAHELVRRLAVGYPGGVVIEERGTDPAPALGILQQWMREHIGEEPPQREYQPSVVRGVLAENYGEMLFLFDDVPAGDFAEIQQLLEAVPDGATKILTTRSADLSNELGVSYSLKRLDEDDALELVCVRLRDRFMAGGERSRKEFDRLLDKRKVPLLTLIEKVEGHPLALHLGIGTLDNLGGIEEVVEELTESLERGVESFEVRTALKAADKNQSLAHSLAVSLKDLVVNDTKKSSDWERRFRALGLFPDGSKIPRGLILAVWGDDDSTRSQGLNALSGLVRREMLGLELLSSHYFNHPVIRAYATGLLADKPSELEEARGRYWRWVIEKATEGFSKPQAEWQELWPLAPHIRRVSFGIIDAVEAEGLPINEAAKPEPLVDEEAEELRGVARDTIELALRLANSLKEYYIRRPEREEGLKVLRLGLAAARANESGPEEIEFLKRLGGALARRDPDRARRYLDCALVLAREAENRKQEGAILSYSGELERTQGNSEDALARLDEAQKIHQELGNQRLQASTLKYRGEVFWRMSRHDEAVASYHQARALYEAVGSTSGKADILNKLGSVEFNSGRHREAIELFQEALDLHRKVGNRSMEAEDLNDMGAAHRYLAEPAIALGRFRESLELHLELGNRRLESIARSNIAGTLCDLEQYQEGHSEALRAKGIALEVKAPIPLFWAHCWEAKALRGLGDRGPAEERMREALTIIRGEDNPRGLAGGLGMLGELLSERRAGKVEAAKLLREAIQVMDAAKPKLDQAFGGQRRAELEELLKRIEA